MDMLSFVRKKDALRGNGVGRSAMARIVEGFSNKGEAEERAEICNEAVARVLESCFYADRYGNMLNINRTNGMLKIPVPWGKHGYRRYRGMGSVESNVLREYLFEIMRDGDMTPVFVYDAVTRRWYLNVLDGFNRYADAVDQWKRMEMDGRDWGRILERIKGRYR